MKLTDLPNYGSISIGHHDYEWMVNRKRNEIIISRAAEADNPHYEAYVSFPNDVIDYADAENWEVSVASINQNGGACELDEAYIDQFESLFDYFARTYGENKSPA